MTYAHIYCFASLVHDSILTTADLIVITNFSHIGTDT